MDLGSEFVYISALLIHIKSRSLLRSDPQTAVRKPDPREESLYGNCLTIINSTKGPNLSNRNWKSPRLPVEGPNLEFLSAPPWFPEPSQALNLWQILRIAQQALAAAMNCDLVTPTDPVSVAEMILRSRIALPALVDPVEGTALLEEQPDASHRGALFLAMLDMAKSGKIRLEQSIFFGAITIANNGAQIVPDIG